MTTPCHPPALSEQELASTIKAALIGQDAVANAVAREFVRRTTSRPADRPVGILLLAGPDQNDAHLTIAGCLEEVLQSTATAYNLELGWGHDLFLFGSIPVEAKAVTLVDHVRAHPGSLVVFAAVDKAQPQVLARIAAAWRSGTIRDHLGESIPTAGTTFVLTTDLASDQIGQLARNESDPDRLNIECLRLRLDAGFPAVVLTCIDCAFCLCSTTSGELAREQRRRVGEWVAEHELLLEVGGINARVLIDAMDAPISPYAKEDGEDLDYLERWLREAKAQGASEVRLVPGEDGILVVPSGKSAATEPSKSPATAEEGSSPDTSGVRQ